MARPSSRNSDELREETSAVLERCFPQHVKTWLFDAGNNVRTGPYDMSSLSTAITRWRTRLGGHLDAIFSQWPEADREVACGPALNLFLEKMPSMLAEVVRRLEARLRWAMGQLARLKVLAERKGTLDPGEVVLRTDRGEQVLTAGMCAGFAAGSGDGHQFVNRSDKPARYLEISNRDPDDTAAYPDDDLAYAHGPDGRGVFSHKDGTPY